MFGLESCPLVHNPLTKVQLRADTIKLYGPVITTKNKQVSPFSRKPSQVYLKLQHASLVKYGPILRIRKVL